MAIQYNSNFHETLPFSDVARQIALTANTAQSINIPGDATIKYQALFEYTQDSNVFVCLNDVPVIPAANTVGAQLYSEFRPKKRYVQGGDVVQFITPDTAQYVGMTLRQLPG